MRPPPDVANLREAVAATVLVVQLGDQGGGGRGRTTRSTLASWSRKAVAQPIARPGPSKVARMPPPMLLSGRPLHRSTGSLSRSSWTHRTSRPPTAVAQLGGLESRRCWWTAPWPARGWAHGGASRPETPRPPQAPDLGRSHHSSGSLGRSEGLQRPMRRCLGEVVPLAVELGWRPHG